MVLLDAMFPVMFAVAISGFVIALIAWAGFNQKQARANWEVFARKHGLNMTGGKGIGSRPQIQGWMGRVQVRLNTITRGSGKNRSTFTQFHATINAPMPDGLVLSREGLFSKIGKALGGEDVQIGDRQIDESFIIKAGDLKGTHDLLSNPHVKKALLYCIARHPGMRVQGNRVLVEQSGTVGKLPKIEGVFQDLAYLAETFDAAYQELAQQGAEAPAAAKPEPSKASAAEILGDGIRTSGPKVQVQGTAGMTTDLHQLGDALHEYEHKVESGQEHRTEQTSLQGTEESTNVNWKDSFNVDDGDAFSDPHVGDAFDDPHLLDDGAEPAGEYESSAERAMRDYDPTKSLADHPASLEEADVASMGFEDPAAEKAFENPELLEDADERPPLSESDESKTEDASAGGFDELLASLAESGQTSGDREVLIQAHEGRSWEVELEVDRVSSTFGFSLPEALRDGRTVEGKLPGGIKTAVMFPKGKSGEVENLKGGEKLTVFVKVAAWDDLFKKVTLHAE